jgi:hypothetical protein
MTDGEVHCWSILTTFQKVSDVRVLLRPAASLIRQTKKTELVALDYVGVW